MVVAPAAVLSQSDLVHLPRCHATAPLPGGGYDVRTRWNGSESVLLCTLMGKQEADRCGSHNV